MRNRSVPWVLALSAAGFPGAQEPPERERILCAKADPKNRCIPPGPDCVCILDRLEIGVEKAQGRSAGGLAGFSP